MSDGNVELAPDKLETLLGRGSNAIYVMDAKTGAFVYMNDRACDMTGYSREELLGEDISELEVNFNQRLEWSDYVEGMRDHPSFTVEGEHRHRDGSTFPVQVDNDLIELDGDEFVLAVVRNLEEESGKRDKIINYYDYYHELFKYSPVALFEIDLSEAVRYTHNCTSERNLSVEEYFTEDPERFFEIIDRTDFIDINEAALDLFEAKDHDELVENIHTVLVDEALEKLREAFVNMLDGKLGVTVESRTRSLDGEDLYVIFDYMVPPGSRDDYSRVFLAVMDITRRRKTERELEQSLKVKQTLLEEIHHRVKNNMQIIGSLLSTEARNTDSETSVEALENSLNRIRAMALVHENLYDQNQLETFDFEPFLEELCQNLVRLHQDQVENINLTFSVEPVQLDQDTAISCGLIVNELVDNSLKHGFEDGSDAELDVRFRKNTNGKHHLLVSDNGMGYSGNPMMEDEASVGYTILQSLVEYELDGEIEVNTNDGCEVHITF